MARPVPKSAYDYGKRSSGEVHGVVLTQPHIVELILDLAGYNANQDLFTWRLLEPSCGHGAFVVAAARRLLAAAHRAGRTPATLGACIVAFDVDEDHVALTQQALLVELEGFGVARGVARKLVRQWVRCADFLLTPLETGFDAVVGNPPYIRIEQLPAQLHREYRQRYKTLYDRADLYVAFIERGLSLLSAQGILSLICADRWTVNKYGAPLRKLIAEHFFVRAYVNLHKASPFESVVSAYPAIFSLSRSPLPNRASRNLLPSPASRVPVVTLATASPMECAALAGVLAGESPAAAGIHVAYYASFCSGAAPWLLSTQEQVNALRSLEAKFRPIVATARVGIGVASGCDRHYIVDADLDVEGDRLVPLVMREDIQGGVIAAAGRFVLNTFGPDGKVVDLAAYPRLRKYLEAAGRDIRERHVARKNPRAWFRTIDRVYPELVTQPKLLIPDIALANEVVFDSGRYHPHHNLYFVTSDQWDLEVLGGLLSSRVALFFVWSYALKMRGGYLRFQAQYLRRIRLPEPTSLKAALKRRLKLAFRDRDFEQLDALALEAYELPALPAFDFKDTRR